MLAARSAFRTVLSLAAALAASLPAALAANSHCPVTGAAITPGPSSPQEMVNGAPIYFCCNDCVKMFRGDPEKYLLALSPGNCPVEGNPARPDAALRLVVNNQLYYFCSHACAAALEKDPAKYLKSLTDPVTKKSFTVTSDSPHQEYRGEQFYFASADSKTIFDAAPDQYIVVFGERAP